jgi:hypothetical protein
VSRSAPRGSRGAPRGSRGSSRRTWSRLRLPRIGRDPGDRLIAVGVFLFVAGLIAIAVTFIPFVALHRSNTELAVSLGTFATVIGFALGLLGAYRQGRSLNR